MDTNVNLKPMSPSSFSSLVGRSNTKSSIDIIIPFHDQCGKVSRLLESIFSSVKSNSYRITLVDDGSKNLNFVKQMAKVGGVQYYQHEEQRGFGACISTALEATAQIPQSQFGPFPWILIMHSDVVVEGRYWLSQLGLTLQSMKEQGVKMVSPLTDNADNPRLIGVKGKAQDNFVLEEGFLPLYCALAHRELFERVGPIKHYPLCGGEAEEFAYRMRKHGYQQGVCGSSWVHHEGGATIKELLRPKAGRNTSEVKKILEQNKQRCLLETNQQINES